MITGVVLARNEEHHIADCLAALRPHVQEIILIDMESSDRTVELARPLVDQVLIHPLVRAIRCRAKHCHTRRPIRVAVVRGRR